MVWPIALHALALLVQLAEKLPRAQLQRAAHSPIAVAVTTENQL
jgi:hypothetical protein